MTTPPGSPAADPPSLRPRSARPLVVHVLVDVIVAFLALVIVLLVLGTSIWIVVAVAAGIGVGVAPLTHRAEVRALARRPTGTAEG